MDIKSGFLSGGRKIHYVLATQEENLPRLYMFMRNLIKNEIDIDVAAGKKLYYLRFVLIHLPKKVQPKYSKLYQVGAEKENYKYADVDILKGYHFKKLPKLPVTTESGELTNAQCIIILNRMLEKTPYTEAPFDYGITKLKNKRIILDAYPLHDGPMHLQYNEFNDHTIRDCNEREILYRYWANFRVWHYEIPLDLIKKYYGHEIAFYYHWLEYFNLMLFPMAILGTLVIIINMHLVKFTNVHTINDICNAENMYLCPNCILKLFCYYKSLKQYCGLATWTYVFDNNFTILFAILISFWATIFLNVWLRRTNELKLRWDVQTPDYDYTIRREYEEAVKRSRINIISEELEPCLSPCQKLIRYTFVTIIFLILIAVDILVVFGVIYFDLVLKIFILLSPVVFSKSEKQGIRILTGSFLLVVIIKIKAKIIPPIAKWLTTIEMPKTQKNYDKSLMYKRYILSFTNNYTVLLYTAFIKGAFAPTPDKEPSFYVVTHSCRPLACVLDLASQVFFIMLFRRLLWNIFREICSIIRRCYKTYFSRNREVLPQYEDEYWLQPTERDFLQADYNEMIVEYGLVTFFGAAFPLAPLFALLDNLLEMRLSARKLITAVRRPIPRVVPGIGPWEGVLRGLIYLSTAINAFVIAFSTQFVSKEVFLYKNVNLKGFINYTLSEFATKDNKHYTTIEEKHDTCYYMDMREGPNDKNKYQRTSQYWADFTWKFVFLMIFEHVILILNAVLSFAIREVPALVRDHIAFNREKVKEARVKLTKEQEQIMFLRFRGR